MSSVEKSERMLSTRSYMFRSGNHQILPGMDNHKSHDNQIFLGADRHEICGKTATPENSKE